VDRETAGTPRKLSLVAKRLSEADLIVATRLVRRLGVIEGLSVIGVVLADQGLRFPDFRAPERTLENLVELWEMLPDAGRFILQTFYPDHYVVGAFVTGDYRLFYREELRRRERLSFPPFSRLVLVELRGKDSQKVEEVAGKVASFFQEKGLEVLGPAPAPFFQVKNYFRWHLLLRARAFSSLHTALKEFSSRTDLKARGVKLVIDPDPEEIL
jgi:primosomal protein N' (replication factor Y)